MVENKAMMGEVFFLWAGFLSLPALSFEAPFLSPPSPAPGPSPGEAGGMGK